MAVHHQLAQTQHLSAQVEGITESRLLSFLGERNKNLFAEFKKLILFTGIRQRLLTQRSKLQKKKS